MLENKPELVRDYVASIPFDRRLYRHDIRGSVAHARMLAQQGLIRQEELDTILEGLESIRQEIERGNFEFKSELEDIHMNIEARLFEKIGEVAGKLHTARSRNDQIALDMRLFVKDSIGETLQKLATLQSSLVELAESNKDVVMPGYTHLQQAQPLLFAHHLLAYFEMFERDKARLRDCYRRADVLPLGSGALAGVAYSIDRDYLARELGFAAVSTNSMDAVSDRDFVVEYQSTAAITMMHLSRLAEEFILWSSAEFGFIELGADYTSGSSIMPQKRNPDVAELGRAKTGRVYGNLVANLTMMKGQPLAYNRDLQEDKEPLFDTVDTLLPSLDVFSTMLGQAQVHPEAMREAIAGDYILATDLADYLVSKGLPFRQAHRTVAGIADYAIHQDKRFSELSLEEYRHFSPLFDQDVYSITLESSVAARNVIGGTAPRQVDTALLRAKEVLKGKP
ncbi:MAG: argininosuccinate lyase [Chloroflexota bacterium]